MKKNILAKRKNAYNWKFDNVGGVTRVNIATGDDIAHLGELDQKMWTVLSCPVKGLELDEKTLEMMDTNHDGKIHVNEVVEAANWLTLVLNDPNMLLRQEDTLPLSALNTKNEEGVRLDRSARQILKNLGLEKDSISIADTADRLAIFSKTRFNGDGIITENSTDDEGLKQLIREIMEYCGTMEDRSGEPGIDEERLNNFFQFCEEHKTWIEDGRNRAAEVLPFNDDTEAALEVYNRLKDKVDDYFMRCKLARFNEAAQESLDVSVARIEEISTKSLTDCTEEIASYPLARIRPDGHLYLDAVVNPAWEGDYKKICDCVLKKGEQLSDAEGNYIDERIWKETGPRFDAYVAWKSAKTGGEVEALGYDRLVEILNQNRKDELLGLIEQDRALEGEANDIVAVDKLMHLYRDFYVLLKNFVTFSDFYDKEQKKKAIFQAGTLYLDQRSCKLCLKVSDMAKHNTMAGFSGMYLMYCDCYSKQKNETMQIVAALTNGEVKDIVVGKNALFYDRDGLDWDAKIVKIIENPISVREAFWSPYRKFARFVEAQINKMAASQDEKVTGNVNNQISETGQNLTSEEPKEKTRAKQAFDIAKFCGIFAAIGLALGYIGKFLLDAFKGFISLSWWQMPLAILGLMLLISGPSMLIAWLKLRKRNLAPVLDSNGWAVNARAYVSVPFGRTLTDMANFPKMKLKDPFDKSKKTPVWKKGLYWILALAVVFGVLYFTNTLSSVGLPFREEAPAPVEEVVTDSTTVADEAAPVAQEAEQAPAEAAE